MVCNVFDNDICYCAKCGKIFNTPNNALRPSMFCPDCWNAAEDSFDCGYHLLAREKHKERVAKTPDRVAYAINQFEQNGIMYELKNREIGHFHCFRKSDGKLFQFWAGTGKIIGIDRARGINALMRILMA